MTDHQVSAPMLAIGLDISEDATELALVAVLARLTAEGPTLDIMAVERVSDLSAESIADGVIAQVQHIVDRALVALEPVIVTAMADPISAAVLRAINRRQHAVTIRTVALVMTDADDVNEIDGPDETWSIPPDTLDQLHAAMILNRIGSQVRRIRFANGVDDGALRRALKMADTKPHRFQRFRFTLGKATGEPVGAELALVAAFGMVDALRQPGNGGFSMMVSGSDLEHQLITMFGRIPPPGHLRRPTPSPRLNRPSGYRQARDSPNHPHTGLLPRGDPDQLGRWDAEGWWITAPPPPRRPARR